MSRYSQFQTRARNALDGGQFERACALACMAISEAFGDIMNDMNLFGKTPEVTCVDELLRARDRWVLAHLTPSLPPTAANEDGISGTCHTIHVKSFHSRALPEALREFADWVEQNNPNIWTTEVSMDKDNEYDIFVYFYPEGEG